jgi:hypothetical protein
MGEFDDLDPAALSQTVEAERARLQGEKADADRKREKDNKSLAEAERAAEDEATRRTTDLMNFLRKAFNGKPMSNGHYLVVERTESRPDSGGTQRYGEMPIWIVIKADSSSTNPRHQPIGGIGTPEHILVARCGIHTKYELIIYPMLKQNEPQSFSTDNRDEFVKRIQSEIADR